jgi:hypothetical protein
LAAHIFLPKSVNNNTDNPALNHVFCKSDIQYSNKCHWVHHGTSHVTIRVIPFHEIWKLIRYDNFGKVQKSLQNLVVNSFMWIHKISIDGLFPSKTHLYFFLNEGLHVMKWLSHPHHLSFWLTIFFAIIYYSYLNYLFVLQNNLLLEIWPHKIICLSSILTKMYFWL